MEEAHIAAAPGCGFGADNFVRFSYACSEDVLKRSMERFGEFCAEL
jgi:aspartate/methionine/tyrosine aminotransferase